MEGGPNRLLQRTRLTSPPPSLSPHTFHHGFSADRNTVRLPMCSRPPRVDTADFGWLLPTGAKAPAVVTTATLISNLRLGILARDNIKYKYKVGRKNTERGPLNTQSGPRQIVRKLNVKKSQEQ